MSILQNVTSYLYILVPLTLFIIGVIVASNIKDSDTDKQKGDKRLVAAVFILVSIIIFLSFKLYSSEAYNSFLLERGAERQRKGL